jgi:hypothetical protein
MRKLAGELGPVKAGGPKPAVLFDLLDIRTKLSGVSFRVDYRKGKGGHAMVYVGDKLTTLPSREIDPKTARKIRKHLGLVVHHSDFDSLAVAG